jgi:hypothetical protein
MNPYLKQLKLWLWGKSEHREDTNECVPDFSCCFPDLLAPFEIRRIFYTAYLKGDEKTMTRLLGEFLNRLLVMSKVDAHIAGLQEERMELNDDIK